MGSRERLRGKMEGEMPNGKSVSMVYGGGSSETKYRRSHDAEVCNNIIF